MSESIASKASGLKMKPEPKYFDYLQEHGQYLTERFAIQCERESLAADIALYRRRRSNENQYWVAAVFVRRLLEQVVDGYLETSPYDYGKMLGERLQGGIDDGLIPRQLGYSMKSLNRLVRDGAHAGEPYTSTELEEAMVQLDLVLRGILRLEGKSISGSEVSIESDEVLLAHSESIEEKGNQAAQLTGDKRLAEESRIANERAMAAEREALAARKMVQQATEENEQLRLQLESAMQTIEEQKAALSKKRASYAKHMRGNNSTDPLFTSLNARADAKAAQLQTAQNESDAKLAEAREASRAKEVAAIKAAEKVSQLEERLDNILSEYDFIKTLLGAKGKATDEQRRIVNFPLNPSHKSRFVNVTGGAGTGKTLCLLAAVINYLEPNRQATISYVDQGIERRALFICYNRDLASYIKGMLERFPRLSGHIEVASYDRFLNQFVRTRPIKEYDYLARYARDVRFRPSIDENGRCHYWELVVEDYEKKDFVRKAIVEIRNYYQSIGEQEYCKSAFLNENDDSNIDWMVDEIEWLEGRYHNLEEGQRLYHDADRAGRGVGRKLQKNSAERTHVFNVWIAYCNILAREHRYTLQQIVTRLLRSKSLPTYDIVAIDEAQDLNMLHIELFTRFMAEGGYLLIAGDEGQKLYPRDFTWKAVDSRARSTTLSLGTNMRNPVEIQRFAERLQRSKPAGGNASSYGKGVVQVRRESKENTAAYVRELASHRDETTVVVTTDLGLWENLLRSVGVATETSKDRCASEETIRMKNGSVRPGVYCFAQLKTKGLEFDNVIIDYSRELDQQDERRERRIRYMQFTRARKTLLIRFEDEPPKLLQNYYSDYLG